MSTLAGSADHSALGRRRPSEIPGTEEAKRRFFLRIYGELENRIKIFTSLRLETLDHYALEKRVREIGKLRVADEEPVS